jgi:hypothetical protein
MGEGMFLWAVKPRAALGAGARPPARFALGYYLSGFPTSSDFGGLVSPLRLRVFATLR